MTRPAISAFATIAIANAPNALKKMIDANVIWQECGLGEGLTSGPRMSETGRERSKAQG